MKTELELKFYLEDVSKFRDLLIKTGAKKISKEQLYRRIAFHLPENFTTKKGWGRVRDEGDKITLSIKLEEGDKIEDQKEVCLEIDSVENGILFLNALGFKEKAYQETKREKWKQGNVDITIDTWPFLNTFVEIEGPSIEDISEVCDKLNLDFESGLVGPVTNLYAAKYNLTSDRINNRTPLIVFNMENPFTK